MNILRKQIKGFFIAGCFANIISFASYVLFYKSLNLSILVSSISAQILGVATNYGINSRYIFKKSLSIKKKFFYAIYYSTAIYFVGLLIKALTSINIEYRVAWFLSIFFVSISNFIFVKYLAFKS